MLDTAGQEEFSAMRDQYMRSGEGFICVYSITERRSFDEMEDFYEQIHRANDRDDYIPMVLVGNKTDLESERQVTTAEGRALAHKFGCQFMEASAKHRINVDEAFNAIVRSIDETRKGRFDSSQKKSTKKRRLRMCTMM